MKSVAFGFSKEEKSISTIDEYVGNKVQVIAFGASYVGRLQKVDYDNDLLIMTDGTNKVTLELGRIESFTRIEE